MSWVAFALAAPVLWAASTHLDKILVARYLQSAGIAVFLVFTALLNVLLLAGLLLFDPAVLHLLPARGVLLLLGSGVAYLLGMYFYLRALKDEDASGIAPFYQATPLFACLMGALVLHEHLHPVQRAGIALTVAGATMLSIGWSGRGRRRFKGKLVLLMLAATFLLALSSLVFKMFSEDEKFWAVTFWSYAGQTLLGLAPLAASGVRKQFAVLLRRQPGPMLTLNGGNELLNLLGGLSMRYALLQAPLSLVQAVTGATPLFVFLFGIALSLWAPRWVKEDLSRRALSLRAVSAAVVVAGVALIAQQPAA